MEDWEQRIEMILGNDSGLSEENANRYRIHLKRSLILPLKVTGREEPYVLGGWSKKDYKFLKKTNPSFTDTFDLLDLLPPDETDDVTAEIKRVSDGKVFTIGLSWLTTVQDTIPEFEALDDYARRHVNY